MKRMNVIMNHNLAAKARARKRENRKRAAKMAAEIGLTLTEFGLLGYAHLGAELSAKPNETVEETNARTIELWHKKVEDWRAEEKRLIDAIMSFPEKERRKLLARMKSSNSRL
jgi:hypothetical protein